MIPLAPRQLVLAAALALTLAAVAWVATHEQGSVHDDLAVDRPDKASAGKMANPLELATPLHRDKPAEPEAEQTQANSQPASEKQIVDLFHPHAWYVAPPPPPPAPIKVVDQAPVVPPMPFVYLGRLDGVVFLTRNNLVLSASQGEMLDSQYRLESVNAGSLIITYLPLNIQQTIIIKGSS